MKLKSSHTGINTLLTVSVLLTLLGCTSSTIQKDLSDNFDESIVQEILVSPENIELFADSPLPKMTAIVIPHTASDTTVLWSSDHPEVLDVDQNTGELVFKTIRNSTVKITATSRKNPKIHGSCNILLHNSRGVYKVIDIRRGTGLWMLDRNIAADAPFLSGMDANFAAETIGDYFQFGMNTPVANKVKGGDDKQGGKGNAKYTRPREGFYPGVYDYWWGNDEYMKKNSFTYEDWSNPKKIPISNMEGWRIPSKEDFEKIIRMCTPSRTASAREKAFARMLKKKLAFPNGGLVDVEWTDLNEPYIAYLWSCSYDPNTHKAWVLKVHEPHTENPRLELVEMKIQGNAMPIRLVKDATESEMSDGDL